MTRAAERADTLAYLRRRLANAETMAKRSAEFGEYGRERARQIEVIIGDIENGLHVDEAATWPEAVAGETRP